MSPARERAAPTPVFAADGEAGKMRSILRAMPELVFFKDPDGVYLGVNARTEAFYALTEDEIIRGRDQEIAPPHLVASYPATDLQAIEAGHSIVNREWLTFKDGHRELNETTKTTTYTADGTLLGVLGLGRDITAAHNAQEALREQEELFEAIVLHDLATRRRRDAADSGGARPG